VNAEEWLDSAKPLPVSPAALIRIQFLVTDAETQIDKPDEIFRTNSTIAV
jgi:hypothetical protein